MNYFSPHRPKGRLYPYYIYENGKNTGVEILFPSIRPEQMAGREIYHLIWSLPTDTKMEYTVRHMLVEVCDIENILNRFKEHPEGFLYKYLNYIIPNIQSKLPVQRVQKFKLEDLI